jgi:hypothetical protein
MELKSSASCFRFKAKYLSDQSYSYVKSKVFPAVTMKNVVFWDVSPFDSSNNDVSEEYMASNFRAKIINEQRIR